MNILQESLGRLVWVFLMMVFPLHKRWKQPPSSLKRRTLEGARIQAGGRCSFLSCALEKATAGSRVYTTRRFLSEL